MKAHNNLPEPPHMSTWKFVDDFKTFVPFRWRKKPKKLLQSCFDFSDGIGLKEIPEDRGQILETLYMDFARFLADLGIPHNRKHEITVEFVALLSSEEFMIEVRENGILIRVPDLEGVRRGVYFLMDEIIKNGGPFLPLRTYQRTPFIKTRISRCYYGPKKRPPVSRQKLLSQPNWKEVLANDPEYRNELLDDFDYYPEAYLSTLAYQGVNALWINADFDEICKSEIIPEYGIFSDLSLKKLNRIVRKCKRYGIKVYIFCIEPSGFSLEPNGKDFRIPLETLKAYPVFKGHSVETGYNFHGYCFCTSSPAGRAYVEEACYYLFSQVPELGGLINLCVGERPTHCYSDYIMDDMQINCPRCKDRQPEEVLTEVLALMRRGIKRANGKAELIAWPYSQYIEWGEKKTLDFVPSTPKDVVLMHNFESRGRTMQLGREHVLDDYWLAYVGPSQLFADCAAVAAENGVRMGAKIQAACSYELATVPFVPVPGILYDKYQAMKNLLVDTVMLGWLIGTCPSVMTKAAGMLSLEPFLETKSEFLTELASIDWGEDAALVAEAWEWFEKAYKNYPYSRIFSYYAPLNAGVVWPLYLYPRDLGLQAPFRAKCPPCGDRIGECLLDDFTLDEAIELCGNMVRFWEKGLNLLEKISVKYSRDEARRKDIGVAVAVGIQISSCLNILKFYQLREELAWTPDFNNKRMILKQLKVIVEQEIKHTKRLCKLARDDDRLGYQADSECHIYFPAKLEWRLAQLERLLSKEFPEINRKLAANTEPFPAYTGLDPGEHFYHSTLVDRLLTIDDPKWQSIEKQSCEQISFRGTEKPAAIEGFTTTWQALHNYDKLYLLVTCAEPDMQSIKQNWRLPAYDQVDCVELILEKQRLWPPYRLAVNSGGETWYITQRNRGKVINDGLWSAEVLRKKDYWQVLFCLPWVFFGQNKIPSRPIRINLRRVIPDRNNMDAYTDLTWCGWHPLPHRLMLPNNNPTELGWLFFS
ncbi:MAG: hypothetical protein WCS27_03980 [Victivallaceae bacterium]